MAKLAAFIARSFSDADDIRLKPILEFLGTFGRVGFICQSAEPAEVESVSAKVRRIIDDCDVFVGFFTRRHPVQVDGVGLIERLRGGQPKVWSAPAWVLQESGYALGRGKRLILLREPDVEIPGLQGDLEYIPFVPENASAVFAKISEMINSLLAEAAGMQVEVTVTTREQIAPAAVEPPSASQEESTIRTEDTEDMFLHALNMSDAASRRDTGAVFDAYRAGNQLLGRGMQEPFDQVHWDALYFRSLYRAGSPGALDNLRGLHAQYPERFEPAEWIADVLFDAKEYEEAVSLYVEAAKLVEGNEKPRLMLRAAEGQIQLKRYSEAERLASDAFSLATGEVRSQAISVLYNALKLKGNKFYALAVGELALHENPIHPVRFKLGLDYRRQNIYELMMYHFRFLHEGDKANSASLHNLALAYSECKLPITSVRHYKSAIELGSTLSAANLGYAYLDGGMADEAKAVVTAAMLSEEHEARVDKCFAEISTRTQQESVKEEELSEAAEETRRFFISMGIGLRSAPSENLEGQWKFPFGDISLHKNGEELTGVADVQREESGFGTLLGKVKTTERCTFNGTLTGSVCSFNLQIEDTSTKPFLGPLAVLGGGGVNRRQGFIVFDTTAASGTYVETEKNKLGEARRVSKA